LAEVSVENGLQPVDSSFWLLLLTAQ